MNIVVDLLLYVATFGLAYSLLAAFIDLRKRWKR